jgi:hypothetical protein
MAGVLGWLSLAWSGSAAAQGLSTARNAAGARLPAVRLDGNYFSRDSQRFLVVAAVGPAGYRG